MQNEAMGYEIYRLIEEGRKRYHEVVLINPAKLYFIMGHNNRSPVVMTENVDITNISTLIIRKTSGYEEPISLLAKALYHKGCDLIDPVERFNGAPAGKLNDSLKGTINNTAPATFIAFNRADAFRLVVRLNKSNNFPLIGKPNRGSKGENVSLLRNLTEANLYIDRFFADPKYQQSALLLQSYINIINEYRVIMIDGICIGMVEKIQENGHVIRNAALGSRFVAASDSEVHEFCLRYVSKKGILGADVARDNTGRLYLLESNRSPQWQAFEKATGINVAMHIIERAWHRLLHPDIRVK
jgi:glutathione synthase/RimK-type ligase-like ATP-grasp enzyme